MTETSRQFRDRLRLGSLVVVADRSMVSAANFEALRSEGIEYAIAERLWRSTANTALARAVRYKRVGRNLRVRETQNAGVERVLVCRDLKRAGEDARQCDAALQQLSEKIAAGGVRPTQEWRTQVPQANGRHCQDRPEEGAVGRALCRQVGAAHHDLSLLRPAI